MQTYQVRTNLSDSFNVFADNDMDAVSKAMSILRQGRPDTPVIDIHLLEAAE